MSSPTVQHATIRVTCLSPVCIQSGREVGPWEYYLDTSELLHRYSPEMLFTTLATSDKKALQTELATYDILKVRAWLHAYLKEQGGVPASVRTVGYPLSVDKEFVKHHKANIEKTAEANKLMVHEFVRSPNGPYVPGSSLKGALRTGIIWSLIPQGRTDERMQYIREIEGEIPTKEEKDMKKNGVHKVVEQDMFRAFTVRDAVLSPESLRIGKLRRMKNTHGFYEYMPTGTTFSFEVVYDSSHVAEHSEASVCSASLDPRQMCSTQRTYMEYKIDQYLSHLHEFEQIVEASGGAQRHKYKLEEIEALRALLSQMQSYLTKNENAFLLNLGFGGGFWYKSVNEIHPMIDTVNNSEFGNTNDHESHVSRTWWRHKIDGTGPDNPMFDSPGFIACTIESVRTSP